LFKIKLGGVDDLSKRASAGRQAVLPAPLAPVTKKSTVEAPCDISLTAIYNSPEQLKLRANPLAAGLATASSETLVTSRFRETVDHSEQTNCSRTVFEHKGS
jgi:hypothetical protein